MAVSAPTFFQRAGIALAGAIIASTVSAADISGAGATFPYPIYAKWAEAYKHETGVGLNYQSIGSGGGIKQIKAKTVTFGASDMPLKPEELDEAGLVQFPMIIGGVVPVATHLPVSSWQTAPSPQTSSELHTVMQRPPAGGYVPSHV